MDNHRRLAIYFGLILFLVASFLIRLNLAEELKAIPRNQEITIVATVQTQPKITERGQIIEIGDSSLFVDLYPKYMVGDRLKIEGFVDEKGRIFRANVEKVGQPQGAASILANIRNRIADNIDRLLPSREATLIKGVVLGVDEIGSDLREALIKTGTIHVVVVSGQNLSIVAGLFLSMANVLGRRLSLVLATLAVFIYALLTGFEPPVVRASLMVLFSSVAIYLGRQTIPVWSLLIAALIILFFSPQALFEISFQLTFAATLGIMTLGQWLIKVTKVSKVSNVRKALSLFSQNAAIATSAYLFTLPIIFFYFERVSLTAPLVNTLVAEAVLPLMLLGFAIALASLIFMPFAQVLAFIAYVPAFYFIKIVELFANF